MKDIFKLIFLISLIIVTFIYKDSISTFITDNIIYRNNNKVLTYNEHYIDNDFLFVQNIDTNTVKNYQEVLNMFYTFINSGDTNYNFYCNYKKCVDDITNLINTKDVIANINNFVNPYNSFSTINVDISADGKINVKTKKVYTDNEIDFVENYIEQFIANNINDTMPITDKIKVFHDYIVNNTVYDENNLFKTYTAYNLITTGKSICGGYSDIMAIYLNKLGIKNYKITSSNHVWNLLYLDNIWYHIDATWDDPIANDGNQYLIHNFFMITTNELLALDEVEHNYNSSVYLEANY